MTANLKPQGWSRRSQAPYYKEFYGLQMKRDADKMIENREDTVFRYETWCNANTGMSKVTLYNRINQSIRFLLDHLDENKTYSKWHAMTRVSREEYGVRISFIAEFKEGDESNFGGTLTQTREATPRWKQELDFWLESDKDDPFVRENLNLTAEELKDLKTQLAGLDGIGKSIKYNCIKLVRL